MPPVRNLGLKKSFLDLERPTLHACGAIAHGLMEVIVLTDADLKKDRVPHSTFARDTTTRDVTISPLWVLELFGLGEKLFRKSIATASTPSCLRVLESLS